MSHYERILVETVVFERGWVALSEISEKKIRRRTPTTVVIRKLKSLGYHVALFATS